VLSGGKCGWPTYITGRCACRGNFMVWVGPDIFPDRRLDGCVDVIGDDRGWKEQICDDSLLASQPPCDRINAMISPDNDYVNIYTLVLRPPPLSRLLLSKCQVQEISLDPNS
jgi:hypothetical protein